MGRLIRDLVIELEAADSNREVCAIHGLLR